MFRKDAILCFSRVGYQGVDALYDAILQSPQTKKTEYTMAELTQLELTLVTTILKRKIFR